MTTPLTSLDAWDFELPEDRIARYPTDRRDHSRMLVVDRRRETLEHARFDALPERLDPGDVVIVNDTRVMAARLHGQRKSGGRLEVLALSSGPGPVPCMVRNGRRLQPGEEIEVAGGPATVIGRLPDGLFSLEIPCLVERMEHHGELPLPPYLGRSAEALDRERYQTIFAGPLGAAAAPTAGLHFTPEVLAALQNRGIELHRVTLHVGIGTFRPLTDADLARGELHPEPWVVPRSTAEAVAGAREKGRRVVAVGTTSTRTLESATPNGSTVPRAGAGTTTLFLHPQNTPRCVDGLITNFHLPRSSLLMLVAAFIGRQRLFEAYEAAIRGGYRFYSYGDAMLVL